MAIDRGSGTFTRIARSPTPVERGQLEQSLRFEIRAPTGGDDPGLVDLMTASGLSIPRTRSPGGSRLCNTMLVRSSSRSKGGPPSGLVAVRWFRSLEADRPVADITVLLVGPGDRRRGIGRLLLRAASRSARLAGCETLRLCVNPDQTSLRQFCLANGFDERPTCFVRPLRKRGSQADD